MPPRPPLLAAPRLPRLPPALTWATPGWPLVPFSGYSRFYPNARRGLSCAAVAGACGREGAKAPPAAGALRARAAAAAAAAGRRLWRPRPGGAARSGSLCSRALRGHTTRHARAVCGLAPSGGQGAHTHQGFQPRRRWGTDLTHTGRGPGGPMGWGAGLTRFDEEARARPAGGRVGRIWGGGGRGAAGARDKTGALGAPLPHVWKANRPRMVGGEGGMALAARQRRRARRASSHTRALDGDRLGRGRPPPPPAAAGRGPRRRAGGPRGELLVLRWGRAHTGRGWPGPRRWPGAHGTVATEWGAGGAAPPGARRAPAAAPQRGGGAAVAAGPAGGRSTERGWRRNARPHGMHA
jgi:hypothetical protein